jgi:hypothetical protein
LTSVDLPEPDGPTNDRLRLQAPDLREGQPQALDQFNVAKRLGDEAGVARGLAHDRPLLRLDLPAQQAGEPAEHQYAHEKDRHQRPMFRHRVPDEEADTDQRREQDVDERVDEALGIRAYLEQRGQRLAAALVLELLEIEPQGLAQAVVEDLGAELLHHQPRQVLLQRLREPR